MPSRSSMVLWAVTPTRMSTWSLVDGRSVDAGRGEACELAIELDGDPPRAARLTAVGDRLRVERLGSHTVLLNGVQVTGVETARAGDVLQIGTATLAISVRSPAPAPVEVDELPASLFEPAIHDVLALGRAFSLALWIPERLVSGRETLEFERLLPERRRLFRLGRAVAVMAAPGALERLAAFEGQRVATVDAAAEARPEAVLSSLFERAFGTDDGEPVFTDPVMVALSEVLQRLGERSVVFEGAPGVGKLRLARWATSTERVTPWRAEQEPELLARLAAGGPWIIEGAEGMSDAALHAALHGASRVIALRANVSGEQELQRENVLFIPALRDRPGDIEPLAEACVERARQALGRPELSLAPETRAALREYRWPGNLDELEATVFRACLVAISDVVGVLDLPLKLQPQQPGQLTPLRDAMVEKEREALLVALGQTRWNVTRAAELLGLPRRTVVWRMARLGLRRPSTER